MCINILGVEVCVSIEQKLDPAKRKAERFGADDWFEQARRDADMLQVMNRR